MKYPPGMIVQFHVKKIENTIILRPVGTAGGILSRILYADPRSTTTSGREQNKSLHSLIAGTAAICSPPGALRLDKLFHCLQSLSQKYLVVLPPRQRGIAALCRRGCLQQNSFAGPAAAESYGSRGSAQRSRADRLLLRPATAWPRILV